LNTVELRQPVLEHGTSTKGRWLRARRVRIALWIAVAEGLLVVLDVIPGWTALLVGAALIVFYLFIGRNLRFDTGRQVSWIAALSQVFVALVPALLFVVGVLAVLALALLALIALVALFADRR
jgi:hypothetical protein